jgi:hypothetical protein
MEWRSACHQSKIREAHRLPIRPGDPYRAILHGDQATITNKDGHSVLESDADRFHDWTPIYPCDTITALGNIARDAPKPVTKPEGPTPFDSFLGGLGW